MTVIGDARCSNLIFQRAKPSSPGITVRGSIGNGKSERDKKSSPDYASL